LNGGFPQTYSYVSVTLIVPQRSTIGVDGKNGRRFLFRFSSVVSPDSNAGRGISFAPTRHDGDEGFRRFRRRTVTPLRLHVEAGTMGIIGGAHTGASRALNLLSRENKKFQGQPPKGKMSNSLGEAYTKDDWLKNQEDDFYDDDELTNADLLRAYPVDCLIRKTIEVKDASEISEAMERLLSKEMPVIEWKVEKDWSGPYAKYGIIHGSIDAPKDELTNEDMAIEIFGKRISTNENGLQTIKILVATYANVMLPGIGVPFYF
jgi:hypothetical protein